jgi:hypothetical protein
VAANAAAAAAAVAAVDYVGGGEGDDGRGGNGEGGGRIVALPNCAAMPVMSSEQAAAAAAGGAELNARLDVLARDISQQLDAMRSEMRPLLVAHCVGICAGLALCVHYRNICTCVHCDAMHACGPSCAASGIGNNRRG